MIYETLPRDLALAMADVLRKRADEYEEWSDLSEFNAKARAIVLREEADLLLRLHGGGTA